MNRFKLHVSVGTMPHDKVRRSIELLGTKVTTPRHRQSLFNGGGFDRPCDKREPDHQHRDEDPLSGPHRALLRRSEGD